MFLGNIHPTNSELARYKDIKLISLLEDRGRIVRSNDRNLFKAPYFFCNAYGKYDNHSFISQGQYIWTLRTFTNSHASLIMYCMTEEAYRISQDSASSWTRLRLPVSIKYGLVFSSVYIPLYLFFVIRPLSCSEGLMCFFLQLGKTCQWY